MSGNYILNEKGEPVEEPDVTMWAVWHTANSAACSIANTTIAGATVFTNFFGLDRLFNDGPLELWGTMILGGARDQYRERYTSRADAIAGHARIVAELRRTHWYWRAYYWITGG